MARVTVEDCIDKVDSPYELVLVAKERATQLNSGIEPTLDRDNDKNTVIALREIAEEKIKVPELTESAVYKLRKHIEQVDLILIMSVEPGFGGQKFMPEVLEKTKKIKELVDKKKLKTEIEIDGGINFENCTEAKKAGANVLVSGSTIFKENQGDLKKNIGILRTN